MNITPTIITEYFHYKNKHNKEGLLSVFSDKAVIIDRGENKEVRGFSEIKSWIDKSLSGLNLQTEVFETNNDKGVWIVETVVSGDFKLSPAKFIYHFKIENDKISYLDIEFAGALNK